MFARSRVVWRRLCAGGYGGRCIRRTLVTSVGPPIRKKMTTLDISKLYANKTPITMVTAYSYPSAVHVDAADIDICLVGDSVGMVELGYDTTLPVSMEEMIHHAKAVSRGAERPLLIADLPFGSYERGGAVAYNNAVRFLKECGMDGVKLEGGRTVVDTVRALVDGGVSVMGHIGLTPQRISVLGGFRAQGKSEAAAASLLADALALQAAGAFAIVIECVPPDIAQTITAKLTIPTIGIGAGPHTSGQVLVYHDLLGFFQHAHHAKVSPQFSKAYAAVGAAIQSGLEAFRNEVVAGKFPSDQYSPYKVVNSERSKVDEWIKHTLADTDKHSAATDKAPPHADETIRVY